VTRKLTSLAAVLGTIACAAACVGTGTALAARARTSADGHHRAHAHPRASNTRHARRGCAHTNLQPGRRDIRLIRSAVLCLVNRERAAHGEAPLHPNAHLRRAAQAHTMSMAFDDYFEHSGPGGQTPLSRMRASGYISSHVGYEVGENIAWGTMWLATPRAIVAAWMRSPGHRANILDPRYHDTGIGVCAHPPAALAHGEAGAIYTQDFGRIIG
jgi:uncharacterized protein YkwD